MYNIFVFPLEILLNLIVLFLDKSWIFPKKSAAGRYVTRTAAVLNKSDIRNPFPDLYQSDIRNPLRYFLINKIRFRIYINRIFEIRFATFS